MMRKTTTGAVRILSQSYLAPNDIILQHRCWSSGLAGLKEIPSSAPDAENWNNAKPFEQIPGYRILPVIGTMHSMLPVVGDCSAIPQNNTATIT